MQFREAKNGQLTLRDLQKQFWLSSRHCDSEIYSLISGNSEFRADERMEVYRTTARSAHVSALMDSFPVCRAILGDDYFKLLAKSYFLQTPSHSTDINKYGESFPGHIAQLIGLREELQDFMYLVDLARLEWEFQRVYFATDATMFDINLLQEYCRRFGENIVLTLQPCISLMSSCFNIFEIWDMHQRENIEAVSASTDVRQHLCIYKKNYQVFVEKIGVDVYELLIYIHQHRTLAEIASSFYDRYDLNSALTIVMKNQWLANVK